MPIYEYRCECGNERETLCPFGTAQVCECGKNMEKQWSVPCSPVMKQTGNEMALDSLNSKTTNHIAPKHKVLSAMGLEKPKRTVY